jgi:hypothetical protein
MDKSAFYMVKWLLSFLIFVNPLISFCQQNSIVSIDETIQKIKAREEQENNIAVSKALKNNWPLSLQTNNKNQVTKLTRLDVNGFPIYTSTDNNLISAKTTHTNKLWQNNFNLSGSSTNMKGKLAIWDGGVAMNSHIELNGRIINKDASSQINHSTHVAGTMIARGINPNAKGMAFGVEELNSYDFNSHLSEMMNASSNLLISNHSYGVIAGWNQTLSGDWEFWGNPGENEDYKFGIYNEECQMFDSIAFNAPNYLIVKSVGNNRDKNGPAIGQPYKRLDANGTMINAGNRPIGISNNDSFDVIPTYGVAKNILTVGAIEGIENGIATTQNIKIGSFSNWGPTDDGRIKPDLVANGVEVLSCVANNSTTYEMYNGTSMAAPNVSGSLFLLQELYNQKNSGVFMKAATLKALAIHTTTEAGNAAGPDYKFGWGLLNVEKAAQVINKVITNETKIIESTLTNGNTYSLNIIASGNEKLSATLVWTDPAAAPTTTNLLNNPTLKLINDLDIRIIKNNNTYFPWILNPAFPNNPAIKGDNIRDNVERVDIDDVLPGQSYTIQITHKGNLARGSQAFSLIVSGLGGVSYCNSIPTYFSGTRIDNVTFAGINNTTAAGCTQYKDFGNFTAQLLSNTTYPFSISLSSCDGSTASKFVKVYIDYNANGSFEDAGELVATSGLLFGDANFNTSITTPNNLIQNVFTRMRVVVQETNDVNSITSCNSAITGETQDYKVWFLPSAIDVGINNISIPYSNICANNNQLITVEIVNYGSVAVSNIPINAVIKNGNTTVANLTATYAPTIESGASASYTFQTPFTTNAITNYLVIAKTNLNSDKNNSNDSITLDFKIAPASSTTTAQASICSTTVSLRAFNTNPLQNYLWYNSATATTPIAFGVNTSSTTIASNYYLGSGIVANIGATSKTAFTDGDYQAKGGNYFKYTSTVPLILEKAKLYTAFPGKVFITVADINTINPNGSYTYKSLSKTTLDVIASRPTVVRGDVAGNDPTDFGNTYNINLYLPSGSHAIIVSTDSIANIFRNKNISSNPYPISFSNLFSITGNNATNQNEFYYYLYNMNLKSLDCLSERVLIIPTTATSPIISKVGDSLKAPVGINYQWMKNGVEILGANTQAIRPTSSGNYSCKVTDNGGCEQTSNTINFEFVVNGEELKIYPNPANNSINLILYNNNNTYTEVKIVDAVGKICINKFYNSFTNEKIDVSFLKNGMYTAHITQGNTVFQRKFIVAR